MLLWTVRTTFTMFTYSWMKLFFIYRKETHLKTEITIMGDIWLK